jgi:IS30 family transposase
LANTLTTVADRSNRDAIKALLETETNQDVADRLARALKTAAKP